MTIGRGPTSALVLAAACTMSTAGVAQTAAAQGEPASTAWVKPPPPGQLLEVAKGRRLHILCKGQGEGPTVVIMAGMSQYAAVTGYGKVQDGIARFAHVCIFDRAGLGWSDPQPADWTQEGMVRDLHALLSAADIKGPIVLVGHSMGGAISRLYVETYRQDIAGLILVDAAAGHDFVEFEASIATDGKRLDASLAGAQPGVPVSAMPPGTPAEITMAFTPESLNGLKGEVGALLKMPPERKRVGAPGSLGDLKLIVIRRGKTSQPLTESDIVHREEQEALARMSTDSRVIVAEGSGHLVSVDAPDVMVTAVRQLIDSIKEKKPLA